MKRILSLWLVGLLIAAQPCYAMIVGYSKVSGGGGTTYTQVYADDFDRADSGTVGGSWTSESDTGSLLAIVSNTMQWTGSTDTTAYVEKDFVTTRSKYKNSFDFKASSITTDTSNRSIQIASLKNSSTTLIVALKATSTTINQIDLIWYDEAGSATTTSQSYTFANDTNYSFVVEGSAATGSSTNDGTLKLSVNGTTVINLSGLDTYGRTVRYGRIGMLYTSITGISRTLTFDNYYFGHADS